MIIDNNDLYHFGKEMPYKGKEDRFQTACATYLRIHPLKPFFFHVPNGGYRNVKIDKYGRRIPIEGKRFSKMGVVAGIPDLLLPERNNNYLGLAIELKAIASKHKSIRTTQVECLKKFIQLGWFACVVWNIDSFKYIVDQYFYNEEITLKA